MVAFKGQLSTPCATLCMCIGCLLRVSRNTDMACLLATFPISEIIRLGCHVVLDITYGADAGGLACWPGILVANVAC